MVKVKICGLRTVADANAVMTADVDMIGLVLAPSTRQITIDQALKIAESLPPQIQTVGVFVNPSFEFIAEAVQTIKLDFVQLHGDESSDFAQKIHDELKVKIIKAFPDNSPISFQKMFNYPADLILIDSPRQQYYGGSGQTFDWSKLQHNPEIDYDRFVLAGGLNEANIQSAIKSANPYMVDISSSVETDNQKDPEKIQAFIEQIKGVTQHDK